MGISGESGESIGDGLRAPAVNRDDEQFAIDGHRPEAGFIAIGLAVTGDMHIHG
jgi:hypothetical protein